MNSTDPAPATQNSHARKLCGLLTRRERWGLSWRGFVALLLLLALAAGAWVVKIHSFLAPTKRVEARFLVVEGWVHPFAIRTAVEEFQEHHYKKVFSTGGPVVGSGGYFNDFNTSASVGAESLVKLGLPKERVQMVPCHVSGRDRTYSSALALREYLQTNGMAVASFNVLTEDAHARRTWLLFQKAFGSEVAIGIISAPSPEYDAKRWWRYSEGVREILGESIAYLYAALLFHPAASQ